MIEKIIAPAVVGVIVGFVLLYGDNFKQYFSPDKEITYQLTQSKQVFGPEELGRKNILILDKIVPNVHLAQLLIKNTGKLSLDNIKMQINVEAAESPDLYRIFYATSPKDMFGKVSLGKVNNLSRQLSIDKFVENTSINISVISSESLNIDFIVNKSGLTINESSKDESSENLTYVALLSAFSVLIARLLIDLLSFALKRYSKASAEI